MIQNETLWKAVIVQAFMDLRSTSQKEVSRNNKVKAILWINLNNADFLKTCEFANFDPVYLYDKKLEMRKQWN